MASYELNKELIKVLSVLTRVDIRNIYYNNVYSFNVVNSLLRGKLEYKEEYNDLIEYALNYIRTKLITEISKRQKDLTYIDSLIDFKYTTKISTKLHK